MKNHTQKKYSLLLVLALVPLLLAPVARGQVAGPPEFVDYQGMVFDGAGKPLGSTADPTPLAKPTNYKMQFKIWGTQSGGTVPKWAEEQVVTVSLGSFSVRLGSGAAISTLADYHSSLAEVFNEKERYLETTVIFPGQSTGTPITPRLAFQSSPFAFVAQRAVQADSVDGRVNASGDSFFSGGYFSGGTFNGNGAGLTALNGANLNNQSVDMTKLVAAVQQALCPPGTILPYAGDNAPAGWHLCNGASYAINNPTYQNLYTLIRERFGGGGGSFNMPDFRGRFLRGRDGGVIRDPDRGSRTNIVGGAIGDLVGSLQSDAFQQHTHTYSKPPICCDADSSSSGYYEVSGYITDTTGGANSGRFSTETRPVNAYVNYIIKL